MVEKFGEVFDDWYAKYADGGKKRPFGSQCSLRAGKRRKYLIPYQVRDDHGKEEMTDIERKHWIPYQVRDDRIRAVG